MKTLLSALALVGAILVAPAYAAAPTAVVQGIQASTGTVASISARKFTNEYALVVTSPATGGAIDAYSKGLNIRTTMVTIAGGSSVTFGADATRRAITFGSDSANTVNVRVGQATVASTTIGQEVIPASVVGFNMSGAAAWKIVNVSGVTAVTIQVTEELN